MNEQALKEDNLKLIKEVESSPEQTQRVISTKLGFSLGKTNYLIKELIKKGFIKAQNFTSGKNKIKKAQYFLTPKGIEERFSLTYHFLKRKEEEYNNMQREWKKIVKDNNHSKKIKG